MIGWKKKMEYRLCNTKEELELEFFQEFEFQEGIEVAQAEEKTLLSEMIYFSGRGFLEIGRVLKIVDNKAICKSNEDDKKYIIIDGMPELSKVGQNLLIAKENYYTNSTEEMEIVPIAEEVLNLEFLKSLGKTIFGIGNSRRKMIPIEDCELLTKEYLVTKFKEKSSKQEVEEAKEKKIEEEERRRGEKEKLEKEKKEKEDFDNNNLVLENIVVKGKDIVLQDGTKYTFLEDVNKVLTLNFIREELNYRAWRQDETLREHCIEKQICFIYEGISISRGNNPSFQPKYALMFSEVGISLNGKRISKNKITFLITKIMQGYLKSDDEIEMLNKLSGMKFDLLNVKEVDFRGTENYSLDISFRMINQDNFEMEFIDVKKILGWEIIRELFFGKGRSFNSYIDLPKLIKIGTENLGLKKQDIYDYLKSVVIMKNLKGENEEN